MADPNKPPNKALPASRVQKIMKADRDIAICSKEAIHLIAAAAEHFIEKLADSAYTQARLDKRKIIQYKDLATAVKKPGEGPTEFLYLEEIIPHTIPLAEAQVKRKAVVTAEATAAAASLPKKRGRKPKAKPEAPSSQAEPSEAPAMASQPSQSLLQFAAPGSALANSALNGTSQAVHPATGLPMFVQTMPPAPGLNGAGSPTTRVFIPPPTPQSGAVSSPTRMTSSPEKSMADVSQMESLADISQMESMVDDGEPAVQMQMD